MKLWDPFNHKIWRSLNKGRFNENIDKSSSSQHLQQIIWAYNVIFKFNSIFHDSMDILCSILWFLGTAFVYFFEKLETVMTIEK